MNGKTLQLENGSNVTAAPYEGTIHVTVGGPGRPPATARLTAIQAHELATELATQAAFLDEHPSTADGRKPYVVDQASGKHRAPREGDTPHGVR